MTAAHYLPELSEKEMLDLLDAERVGRLGLNDEPQPYVVPTDFDFQDGVVYVHSPAEGKKTALARENSRLLRGGPVQADVTVYRSVIVRSEIGEVPDGAERREAMRRMAKKAVRSGGWKAHVSGRPGVGSIVIFKIKISEMAGIPSGQRSCSRLFPGSPKDSRSRSPGSCCQAFASLR